VEGGRTAAVTKNKRTDSVRCSECTTCTNRGLFIKDLISGDTGTDTSVDAHNIGTEENKS